jgi:hypothetical protein
VACRSLIETFFRFRRHLQKLIFTTNRLSLQLSCAKPPSDAVSLIRRYSSLWLSRRLGLSESQHVFLGVKPKFGPSRKSGIPFRVSRSSFNVSAPPWNRVRRAWLELGPTAVRVVEHSRFYELCSRTQMFWSAQAHTVCGIFVLMRSKGVQ